MATRVRSFAKINLGLAVGPPRADGFHGLSTVYQTIGLHDFVTVSARRVASSAGTRITLTANHPGVPRTETGDAEKNTAWRMVAGALARMGVAAEVRIDLDKRLPVQGGLGAGSANAVAALMGLERELGVALPGSERMRLAAEIGSDVPLFLLGGTVLGLGRGEEVYPLPDLEVAACVIATPGVGVSTRQAFADLDARYQGPGFRAQGSGAELSPGPRIGTRGTRSGSGFPSGVTTQKTVLETAAGGGLLTSDVENDRLKRLSCASAAVWALSGVRAGDRPQTSGTTPDKLLELDSGTSQALRTERDEASTEGAAGGLAESPLLALVRTGIENDFQEVVFSQHPFLRDIQHGLTGSGTSRALVAALSGSGSALFGLYSSQAAAREAQQRVEAAGTRALLTETLQREAYFSTMFQE